MQLDRRRYEEALAREESGEGLDLTTAQQTLNAFGGPFAGTSSAALQKSVRESVADQQKAATNNNTLQHGTGADTYDESKHPRGPHGEFIQSGDSGHAVKGVQTLLGGTTPDGNFGPQLTTNIRQFQANHGLEVDGVVGQQTAAALLGNKDAAQVNPGALRPGQYQRIIAKA